MKVKKYLEERERICTFAAPKEGVEVRQWGKKGESVRLTY